MNYILRINCPGSNEILQDNFACIIYNINRTFAIDPMLKKPTSAILFHFARRFMCECAVFAVRLLPGVVCCIILCPYSLHQNTGKTNEVNHRILNLFLVWFLENPIH